MKRTTIRGGFGALRRARERAGREAAILDAAERVIGRRGFHEAGMTEIAREAEYAIGTLYTLFSSKEALYERLLVTRAEELSAALRAGLAGSPAAIRGRRRGPRERLEAGLDAKIDFFARHLDFVRIYTSTSIVTTAGWGLPPAVVKLREGNIRAVARIFEEARAAGALRSKAEPLDLAIAFHAVVQAFLVRAARAKTFPAEAVRESVRATFLDAVFAPRPAAGPAPRGRPARDGRRAS
jgi:AcrR family transcriptional regulator